MIPAIGIHKGIPANDYHHWSALSNSHLNHLRKSPAHLQAYLAEPSKDTPAFKLGRAIHCAILEPDIFPTTYFLGLDVDRRTKQGKTAWVDFLKTHDESCVLSPADYARCAAIRDAVWKKKTARVLLEAVGEAELSIAWDRNGVLCKARYDWISQELDGGTIVDLKSTTDASPKQFEKSIFNFGYHRQGAFYLDGAAPCHIPVENYVVLAVEKDPPYESAAYKIKTEVLQAGWLQVEPLIEKYKACCERGEWPGYADIFTDIGIPAWGWSELSNEGIIGGDF